MYHGLCECIALGVVKVATRVNEQLLEKNKKEEVIEGHIEGAGLAEMDHAR